MMLTVGILVFLVAGCHAQHGSNHHPPVHHTTHDHTTHEHTTHAHGTVTTSAATAPPPVTTTVAPPVTTTNGANAAINDLNAIYNEKLCLDLLLVDCAKHQTVNDERICASNGQTYANHCYFTHAMCFHLLDDPTTTSGQFSLSSHGECPPATTHAPSGSTHAPITTTTASQAVTTDPLAAVIEGVFCQNAVYIQCSSSFDIVCGSDGQLYPNQCELSKARCKNPTLSIADRDSCTIPGSK